MRKGNVKIRFSSPVEATKCKLLTEEPKRDESHIISSQVPSNFQPQRECKAERERLELGVDEWKMSVEAGNGRCVGEVMEGRLCWRHILSPPAKVEITPG